MAVLVLAIVASANEALAMLTAKANHDHITIDFFYHGSSVSVRGISEPGTDLIVKITSPDGHESLKKKGKVGGALWMNVGELKFGNVPSFYAVHSTKKLDNIVSRDEQDKYVIGYPALERHVEITPVKAEAEKASWFSEFVKFKEANKVYATSAGNIKTEIKNRVQEYYILTDWPHQAAPGTYTVSVYAVKNNKVIEQAEARVLVEQVGVVKALAGMAKNSAPFYGILSIGAALGAGFGVGMVFRKGGGSH